MKRNLKEAVSVIEVAISKCLCGGKLHPSELQEMSHVTYADLMTEHGLDSLMAEKVMTHLKSEKLRQNAQSLMTWEPAGRMNFSDPRPSPTFTNSIREGRTLHEDLGVDLEDITDMTFSETPSEPEDGRMLDYGDTKSDSHEGRMMRQALYEMSEYSKDLHDMLTDDDDLPQWCHYKIAVARACVGKVRHYLEYKIQHPKQK